MRSAIGGAVCGFCVALLLGATYSPGVPREWWTSAHTGCLEKVADTALVLGGTSLGTVSNVDFEAGASCTVIPPDGTPASVALRCHVAKGSAEIFASVPTLASAPAGQWCVEVRRVAP